MLWVKLMTLRLRSTECQSLEVEQWNNALLFLSLHCLFAEMQSHILEWLQNFRTFLCSQCSDCNGLENSSKCIMYVYSITHLVSPVFCIILESDWSMFFFKCFKSDATPVPVKFSHVIVTKKKIMDKIAGLKLKVFCGSRKTFSVSIQMCHIWTKCNREIASSNSMNLTHQGK